MIPRGLPRSEAAAYVGCCPRTFDGMILDGTMPQPRMIGGKKVWDKLELDESFERLPRPDSEGGDWDDDSGD